MENPLKALRSVGRSVFWGRISDNTAIKDVPEFDELNLNNQGLSPDAIKALKEGQVEAAQTEKEFEAPSKKAPQQPAVATKANTQVKAPSSRTSIVRGESPDRDKGDEDTEKERTFGPNNW